MGGVLLGVALALGFAAGALGQSHGAGAAAVCLLASTPVLLARPAWAALLAIAVLPFELSVVVGGVSLGPSDVLLALVLGGVLVRCLGDPATRAQMRALRPLATPLACYFAVAVVTASAHLSAKGMVALVQRAEVVVVAIVLGVYLVHRRLAILAMSLFVAGALVLVALWTVGGGSPEVLAGQKNPAGQFIVDGALVALVVVRRTHWRALLFVVLVVGAYATQSRGALIGLVVGLLVFFALRAADPLQFVAQALAVAVVLVGAYETLPHSAQDRLRGDTASTRYNDALRRSYSTDAKEIIRANPVLGVGIGNYLAGGVADMTRTDDPHDVILLEAAEGGYALPVAFGILQLGAVVAIVRRRRDIRWVAPACAVQAAIVTHALVDVYWVRGTPVLGWVLVGMAAAEHARRERRGPGLRPRPVATLGPRPP